MLTVLHRMGPPCFSVHCSVYLVWLLNVIVVLRFVVTSMLAWRAVVGGRGVRGAVSGLTSVSLLWLDHTLLQNQTFNAYGTPKVRGRRQRQLTELSLESQGPEDPPRRQWQRQGRTVQDSQASSRGGGSTQCPVRL